MVRLITIIIPVFNRADLLPMTIETIKLQSYTNFECLLIDDGSEDKSLDVMREQTINDERFHVLQRTNNYVKGPSGCRNMGLDLAKGSHIQFFDSDDLMDEKHLQEKVEAFDKNTDAVVCQLNEFDDDNHDNRYGLSVINDEGDLSRHVSGEINYYIPGPMWKKELIGDTRFATDIKIYEDLLFNLVNRVKCENIKCIHKPLIHYRRHVNTTTGRMNQNTELLNQKRIAWKHIYNTVIDALKTQEQIDVVKSSLFKYSCLNFYYFLCQKSLRGSAKQFLDMCKYSTSLKDIAILIGLFTVSSVPFLTKKGYKVYKIKSL